MKRNQDSAAEEAKKAGVGKAQHQKQEDEGKQHPDNQIHLVDGQGELIVELFFRVDEIRVVVVQQFLFAGFTLGFGGLKGGLLFFQLGFPLGQQGLPPGQLLLAGGGGLFFHRSVLRSVFSYYSIGF